MVGEELDLELELLLDWSWVLFYFRGCCFENLGNTKNNTNINNEKPLEASGVGLLQ